MIFIIYDILIIGAGPAGITSSIYAARKQLSFILISRDIGGQTALSSDVENYTGYHFISGAQLIEKFEEHLKDYKINLHEKEDVIDIKKRQFHFIIKSNKAVYKSRTIIIASGRSPKELNVPGEREFMGKGVTYCATCDAPLFSGKDVAVIGGGNSALDAILQLTNVASKVYLINKNPELNGDAEMLNKVVKSKNVDIINNAITNEIYGGQFVNGIKIEVKNAEKVIKVQGIFVEVGSAPSVAFAKIVKKNKWNEIIIDKRNMTSIPGIFAAGDVTDVIEKQTIVASGEGAKAVIMVFDYLSKLRGHKFK